VATEEKRDLEVNPLLLEDGNPEREERREIIL